MIDRVLEYRSERLFRNNLVAHRGALDKNSIGRGYGLCIGILVAIRMMQPSHCIGENRSSHDGERSDSPAERVPWLRNVSTSSLALTGNSKRRRWISASLDPTTIVL